MNTPDVLVVGGGIAGVALASAVARAGGTARVLDPHPPQPWPQTYGAWPDELPPGTPLERLWPDTRYTWDGGERLLGRAYALLDNAALLANLLDTPRLDWQVGRAVSVTHETAGSVVQLQSGEALEARLIVDASGHQPALLRPAEARQAQPPGAWQTAFGFSAEFEHPPAPAGAATFMNFRTPHLSPEEFAAQPTFLYVLPQGGGRFFVEETSLSSQPPADLGILQRRLQARLTAMGCSPRQLRDPERVAIRMDAPVPNRHSRVLGYGAAGSLVHPASGYQATHALQRADAVAQALLSSHDPSTASQAAWDVIASPAQRQRHELLLLGHSALLGMSGPQLAEFFWRFFELPPEDWRDFLAHTTPPARLAAIMLRVFGQVPWHLRRVLMQAALSHAPATSQGLGELLRR